MSSPPVEHLREDECMKTTCPSPMVSPLPSTQCLQSPSLEEWRTPFSTSSTPSLLPSPDWPLLTVAPANTPVWPRTSRETEVTDTEHLLLREAARRLKYNVEREQVEDTVSKGECVVQGSLLDQLRDTLTVPGSEDGTTGANQVLAKTIQFIRFVSTRSDLVKRFL